MSLWPVARPLFGDEIVLRSVDWLENLPWRNGNAVNSENDKYEIRLNLRDFTPEEISVKTSNGFIVVEGKHDEKKDEHGFISRKFVRRYSLPEGCAPDNVKSKLTANRVLIITVPIQLKEKGDIEIKVAHEKCKSKL
ncbi:unnamed protein product [Leptidea sinapis]|uniref:SHSP domain-containing protein n=1 Tax=Leptidea sinapis TaxID=189913 RepID=A0A5E4PT51_9NEOP|nr:unnamed protein product [Leptidea sinapis]